MGLLDDAIREHLELKRRHGADPAEIERLEQEALGPVQHRGEYAPAPVDITPHTAFAEEEPEAEPAAGGGAYAYDEYETRVHEAAAEPLESADDEEWEYYADEEEEPPAGGEPAAPPAAGAYAAPASDEVDGEPDGDEEYEEPLPAGSDVPAAVRDDEPPAQGPEDPAQGAYGGAAAEAAYHDEALTEIFGPGEAEPPAREQPPADEPPTQAFSLEDDPSPRGWAEPEAGEPETPPATAADAPDQSTAAFSAEDVADATGRETAASDAPPAGEEEDVLEETPEFLQETPEHDRLWFEQRPPRGFDFDQ